MEKKINYSPNIIIIDLRKYDHLNVLEITY